jgi:Arc/MetJ-type ribon-helix-helix transcriptional regulator
MTNRTARLNIRLPENDLRELEMIRERTGHESLSDVVRDAISEYLEYEASTWNSSVVKSVVPRALLEDIEALIAGGDASDVSQAVTMALTAWVEEKRRYYTEGRELFRRKLAEAVEERGTRDGMTRSAARMRVK